MGVWGLLVGTRPQTQARRVLQGLPGVDRGMLGHATLRGLSKVDKAGGRQALSGMLIEHDLCTKSPKTSLPRKICLADSDMG